MLMSTYMHLTKNRSQNRTKMKPSFVGRVLLIKDYLKRKAQWRFGRIEERVIGKDGVTRGYKRSPNIKWKFTGKTSAVSSRLGSWR